MIALPPCFACKWMNAETGNTCAAYPDGIPPEILVKGASHDEPYGDEVDGIVFELDPAEQHYHEVREKFINRKRIRQE